MHGLSTHTILADNQEVDDNTCIKRSDLTDQGFEFLKKAYDKWGDKVIDRKILPTDPKILDKTLKIIGEKE